MSDSYRVTLATEGLGIRFGGHQAVQDVTASFRAGELTAIVGPNGAGKTTYFNLISGQLAATSGSVRLHGQNVTSFSAAQNGLALPAGDDGVPMAVGKAAILHAIRSLLDGETKVTTVHHAHTPEIRLTSDVTATGIWAMEDLLWWWDEGVEQRFQGWGHYYETYEKIDGVWLIASRALKRIRTTETPDFFRYIPR